MIKNHPDGALFVSLAVFTAAQDCLDTDGAKAIVPAVALFLVLLVLKITSAGLLAAKMYRDKSFTDKQKQDKEATVVDSTVKTLEVKPSGESVQTTVAKTTTEPKI